MSDTKIDIKVDNSDNTVSLSVEMKLKPPVWSREYTKQLPNEEYERFHWTDAANYLVEKGHKIEPKPTSGPNKARNDSEDLRAGKWIFKLKEKPQVVKPKKVKATKKQTSKSKEA